MRISENEIIRIAKDREWWREMTVNILAEQGTYREEGDKTIIIVTHSFVFMKYLAVPPSSSSLLSELLPVVLAPLSEWLSVNFLGSEIVCLLFSLVGVSGGGSILMDGSHSPGGSTVTFSRNSSIPAIRSSLFLAK